MDDWPTERESMPRAARRLSNRLGQFENIATELHTNMVNSLVSYSWDDSEAGP